MFLWQRVVGVFFVHGPFLQICQLMFSQRKSDGCKTPAVGCSFSLIIKNYQHMSGFELISYLWIFGNKAVCNIFSLFFFLPLSLHMCASIHMQFL